MDQRFQSLHGFIIANLFPSNNSNIHEIISEHQVQQNLSISDLVKIRIQLHTKAKYLQMVDYIIYQ